MDQSPPRRSLLDKYLLGPNEVIGSGILHALKPMAAGAVGVNQALANLVGLGQKTPEEAEYDAKVLMDRYIQPGQAGIDTIQQDLAPAIQKAGHTVIPAAKAAWAASPLSPLYDGIVKPASEAFDKGAAADTDLARRYLGPDAGYLTDKAASLTKNAAVNAVPFGAEGELAEAAAPGIESYLKYRAPVLPDGAKASTLEREAAANARRQAEGLPTPEVEPSQFAGRQAEAEGMAARRDRGVAISVNKATDVGHPEAGLIGYHPDATVIDAHSPTGEHLGRLVAEPGEGMMQGRTADVYDEANRGQGIGTQMLRRGIDHAHDNDMDWGSDVKLSPGQVATYMKMQEKGYPIQFNPTSAVQDDKFLTSGDGKPVITIPKPTPADEAHVGETPSFNPNSYVGSQAYAGGGSVAKGLAEMLATYAPEALAGMPRKATVPGIGMLDVGPNAAARQAAAAYKLQAGIKSNPITHYAQVDPDRAARIAAAYDAMPHAPDDPKVKASYDAMVKETLAQYQHMKQAGVNVEFMPEGQPDPYAASPRLVAHDVAKNNHMYVYPTDAGFGSSGADVSGNPLLVQSGEMFGDKPATNNDIFRAVHDYFGHVKEGVGFRANGEENAWRQHAGMYSDLARPAMTAETRGQNSWVNYGPHGATNRTAGPLDTVYADQKTGLLPDEFNTPDDGMMHFLHMSNLSTPTATLDPKFYGRGMKGAEARRGGMKTTSLYPWDIDPTDIEGPLQGKTPYHVAVPKSSMYDLSADPEGHLANAESFSDAESAIKGAGYVGYHVPQGDGLFRGQGRLFGPHPATRVGPGPVAEAPEEDLASGFAEGGKVGVGSFDPTDPDITKAKGGVVHMKEGGAAGSILGGIGDLVERYAPKAVDAIDPAATELPGESSILADAVKNNGGVTYNPTTGEMPTSGYAIPFHGHRTQMFDSAPPAADIHDYLMQHQDAFDEDPSAALHIVSNDAGHHLVSVVHHEPDFEAAMEKARTSSAPWINSVQTGENFPTTPAVPEDLHIPASDHDQSDVESYFGSMNARPSTQWTHGQQTVSNPKRNAFPGIYNDPRQVAADASSKVGPEDPLLQRLFGVSRADLSDIALSRQGNLQGKLPGEKANPRGAAAARDVMTPANEQRLIDVLSESKKHTGLYQGMTGWYSMDPLFERFKQIYGDEDAIEKYRQFNTLMGMASPGSDVGTEIARGTSANWLHSNGRFNDFIKYGGGMEDHAPEDLRELPGHVYHRTAQAIPMRQYLDTGEMQMKSPKVPMYIDASGVPETGFQTETPVGDAHWARGVGLADTRGTRTSKGQEIVPGSSVSTPEMQTLAPWWRDRVAGQVGLESVPAQALAWGAFSPYTGVKSAIGAPKLEILSTQIGKAAQRLGISPEAARDLIISGKAGAFSEGGSVD